MKKCLFFLCLCLVPFVVFSSTTFTSQNPIELPRDKFVPVLDTKGNPLDPDSSYRIESINWGALGGDLYLGPSPNSSAPCDNGVFIGAPGTPVGFIGAYPYPLPILPPPFRPIFENGDLNIMFMNIPVAPECVNHTIWKVGDYDVSLGASLLETGGTLLNLDSSWFRIVKEPRFAYKLFNCPGPFACPPCPFPLVCPPCPSCQEVTVVIQDGKRRLALVDDQSEAVTFPLAVNFAKV